MNMNRPVEEIYAIKSAEVAVFSLRVAIGAYAAAGFGNHITEPLENALKDAEYSLAELQS